MGRRRDRQTCVRGDFSENSAQIGRDPVPYGIEANRQTIGEVIDYALEQGIINNRVSVESLFAANTLGLTG